MTDLGTSLVVALDLIISLDPDLVEIVLLSLRVSLVAVVVASGIGLPLGAAIAIGRCPGCIDHTDHRCLDAPDDRRSVS